MTVRKRLLLMLLCVSLLPVVSPGILHAQPQPRDDARQQFADPMERIEAEWMERQEEMDLRLEQWESEQEHRRQEEGENFDEEAYAFQRSLLARRRGLAERRMRLDVETHLAYRALDQAQQGLEEEAQAYFGERQRSNMEDHAQAWEDEQQRRREDEGENFDEEAYEFEKGLMERRAELEKRRMLLEEETHQAHKDLDANGQPGHVNAQQRESIDGGAEEHRRALDGEFEALEEAQQDHHAERQRSDIAGHAEEWEAEQERRRKEEGENFDEEAYEFERGLMARRQALVERGIELDEKIHQAYQDLEANGQPGHVNANQRQVIQRREKEQRTALDTEFQALEEAAQKYHVQRRQARVERFEQAWEEKQDQLREELGDEFDEQAYEAQKELLGRWRELEERRTRLDEKMHQAFRDLDAKRLPRHVDQQERQKVERRARGEHEALDVEFDALEEEADRLGLRSGREGDEHENGE